MRAGGTSPTDPHRPGPVDQRSVVTLRPRSSIAIGAFGTVAGLALLVPALAAPDRDWLTISTIVLALVLLGLFVVRPCAQLRHDGIRLVNPLRVVDLAWPAIEEVRSRWALELVSAGRRYTAWGVPADPGRPRHGRSTVAPSRSTGRRPEAQSPGLQGKVEAQTVAEEIERRIAADRRRPAGTRRLPAPDDVQSWDVAAVALLVGATAFFLAALLVP